MTSFFPKRKRIVLINRDFQLRYTRIAVVIGAITTLLTMFLIIFPLYQFNIIRSLKFLPPPFLVGMAIAAFLNFFVVAFLGVLVTHRIAGPMYALTRKMREVASGHIHSQLTIRKDDDLKYLVRNFNEMLEGLTHMVQSDIEILDKAIVAGEKTMDTKELQSVRDLRDRMQARLSAPKTKDENK